MPVRELVQRRERENRAHRQVNCARVEWHKYANIYKQQLPGEDEKNIFYVEAKKMELYRPNERLFCATYLAFGLTSTFRNSYEKRQLEKKYHPKMQFN